jgi:hypothetical protein
VFFDKAGKEISRNQGVLDEEELAKEAARVITN